MLALYVFIMSFRSPTYTAPPLLSLLRPNYIHPVGPYMAEALSVSIVGLIDIFLDGGRVFSSTSSPLPSGES